MSHALNKSPEMWADDMRKGLKVPLFTTRAYAAALYALTVYNVLFLLGGGVVLVQADLSLTTDFVGRLAFVALVMGMSAFTAWCWCLRLLAAVECTRAHVKYWDWRGEPHVLGWEGIGTLLLSIDSLVILCESNGSRCVIRMPMVEFWHEMVKDMLIRTVVERSRLRYAGRRRVNLLKLADVWTRP